MADQLAFDFYNITYSEVGTDSFLRLQVDGWGDDEDEASVHPGYLLAPYGYFCRPLDPGKDPNGTLIGSQACEGLGVWQGGTLRVMPLADPRTTLLQPKNAKGTVGLQCWTGAFHCFDGTAGSYFLYCPYSFSGPPSDLQPGGTPTKSCSIEVNVDTAGAESIAILHGEGMGLRMTAADKTATLHGRPTSMGGKGTFLSVGDDGVTVNGNLKINGTVTTGNIAQGQPVSLAPATLEAIQVLSDRIKFILQAIADFIPAVSSPSVFSPTDLAQLPDQLAALQALPDFASKQTKAT